MAEDCPERFDLAFLLYVARWNHGSRQRLEHRLAPHAAKVIRLRKPAAAQRWLDSLRRV